MQKRIVFGALAGILGVCLTAGMTLAIDITECNQFIPAREVGVLQADLDCDLAPGAKRCILEPEVECATDDDCTNGRCVVLDSAVILGGNARLRMNGHTIHGGTHGIQCLSKTALHPRANGQCIIQGPGEIVDPQSVGIHHDSRRLIVEDVIVSGGTYAGIFSPSAARRVDLTNVTVRGGGFGVGNFWQLRATNLTVSDTEECGICVGKTRGTNITLDNNMVGMRGGARVDGLVATNNRGPAVEGLFLGVRLKNATLSNNDTLGEGIDIFSQRRPGLTNTTCSRSERLVCEPPISSSCTPTGESWGVCSLD